MFGIARYGFINRVTWNKTFVGNASDYAYALYIHILVYLYIFALELEAGSCLQYK